MRRKKAKKLVFLTCFMVCFVCAPDICKAIDIYVIEIHSGKGWCDGILEDKPYSFWLCVNTSTDVNAVTVTPPAPANSPISLVKWGLSMWSWENEDLYEYSSLSGLRSNFPLGDYTFSFNNGEDSITLTHNPSEPTNYPEIIEPNHNANDVPRDVTIKWQSCVGDGDGLRLHLWDETDFEMVEIYKYPYLDIEKTSWTLPILDMGHLYELEILLFDGISGQPSIKQTDQGDSFDYFDLFGHINTIEFTTSSYPSGPFYEYQIVPFLDPDIEYVFIKNTNNVNSWAGEDYGAVRITGILNENEQYPGLLFPEAGFYDQQGAFLVYDINDESGNGALCALTSEFPESDGGPGNSGLPTNLNNCTLHVDIDFEVPGKPSINTLYETLGLWLAEADGDSFEIDATPGLYDLTKGWHTYTFDLNDLANWPEWPEVGDFGDSPVTLLALSFEDPNNAENIDRVVYFIDNFRITGQETFFEDFEARCPSSNEADLNEDCKVDFKDFAEFADNWLWQASWY